nr:hypothetical protein [Planococcus glaciei]
MIWKLALNGLQRNRRDYLILFTGMIISVAVFYMFLAMALNKEFITQNTVINHIQLVFVVGAALLSVITFFLFVLHQLIPAVAPKKGIRPV